jgi:hypothetical protein
MTQHGGKPVAGSTITRRPPTLSAGAGIGVERTVCFLDGRQRRRDRRITGFPQRRPERNCIADKKK